MVMVIARSLSYCFSLLLGFKLIQIQYIFSSFVLLYFHNLQYVCSMSHSPLYTPPNPPPPSRRKQNPSEHIAKSPSSQHLVWILSTITLTALAIVPQELLPSLSLPGQPHQQQSTWAFNRTETAPTTCQSILNAEQRLSRDQLNQFLSIAQEPSQASVHETIAPPYCTLSRANQTKQQEVYPLAFDPDTWFVVSYDQGIYQGYDFVFQK